MAANPTRAQRQQQQRFDNLARASFMGYEFPIVACEILGGIRDHVHEYPHASGGAVEKLGRRLYAIHMEAPFHNTFREYPDLWPTKLSYLRTYFERQTTGPLVIPTIGKIDAYCRVWTEKQTAKALSGVSMSFEFMEDTGSPELKDALVKKKARFLDIYGDYNAAMLRAEYEREADISIFDAVSNALNAVIAISDTVDAAGSLVSAKLANLIDLIDQADKTRTAQNPSNWPVLRVLHDMWEQSLASTYTSLARVENPRTYIVPFTTPLSSISTALYGNATHTVDLMQINPIEDPFSVRAGTKITYVPTSSGKTTVLGSTSTL